MIDVTDGGADHNVGTLDIVVEPLDGADLLAEAALSAVHSRRVEGVADESVAVAVECEPDPDRHEAVFDATLEEARDRWVIRGELFINCGGPMLASGIFLTLLGILLHLWLGE